jgi:hypothetical protein
MESVCIYMGVWRDRLRSESVQGTGTERGRTLGLPGARGGAQGCDEGGVGLQLVQDSLTLPD